MAKRTFLADIDLALNQILAARLENLAAAPAHAVGRVYYNTADKFIYYSDGTTWYQLITNSDSRLTNARTPTPHVIATNAALGAEHTISGGVVGAVLRASAANAANFQVLAHSDLSGIGTNTHAAIDIVLAALATTYAPIAKGVTGGDAHDHNGGDGAQIAHSSLSGIGTNTHSQIDSHIADLSIHRQINDAAASLTSLYSSTKIESLIAALNSTVAGALLYKGGYDAATNAPLLDATPIGGIKQGWTYVVTVAGSFFATAVSPGDMIIAVQDAPTLATHWTIVNKDIPDIVAASEIAAGMIEIATQIEVQAGTDDTRAITPLKLRQQLGVSSTTQEAYKDMANGLSLPRKFSKLIGDGVALTFAITHNLGTTNTLVQVSRVAAPFDNVLCEIVDTGVNVTTVNVNVAPSANQYMVTIIG